MATTSYKVVEHEYVNRWEPEEDWGSTRDVVSDGPFKTVIWRDEMEGEMTDEHVLAYLSDLLSDQMQEDNAFDCTEYNYFVYRNDGGTWRWVGKLTHIPQSDEPVDFEEEQEREAESVCEKCGMDPCYCDYIPPEELDPMDSCYFCGTEDCPGGCFEEKKACRTWLSESPSRHFWRVYYWLQSALNRRAA